MQTNADGNFVTYEGPTDGIASNRPGLGDSLN